ncbi:hypothetical protein KPC83_02485 [Collinsella sp. zg1085]|uniref:hypothetical protein n=1 Tax=Collinsella sp. zg1085 TaxID=2844380 RepID=UPI001C0B0F72|nr:hypothetical protein [Collinsella sp. zg1085]QWT18023.1 hypothetical protein KPC83_02485 [Collinsella sp. zg1085]
MHGSFLLYDMRATARTGYLVVVVAVVAVIVVVVVSLLVAVRSLFCHARPYMQLLRALPHYLSEYGVRLKL